MRRRVVLASDDESDGFSSPMSDMDGSEVGGDDIMMNGDGSVDGGEYTMVNGDASVEGGEDLMVHGDASVDGGGGSTSTSVKVMDGGSVSVDAPDGGQGEAVLETHENQFEDMMENSSSLPRIAAGSLVDGIEVADPTDSIGLDAILEAHMSSRKSRTTVTTMEKLSAVNYQSRGSYGMRLASVSNGPISKDADYPVGEEGDELHRHTHHPDDPVLPQQSQYFTSATGESIPSSREIYPVGSKLPAGVEPNSERNFDTQTTVPFTASSRQAPSPLVVIPYTGRHLTSSAALAGDIEDISDYLQQDIVNSKALVRSVSEDIPSTDPPSGRNGSSRNTEEDESAHQDMRADKTDGRHGSEQASAAGREKVKSKKSKRQQEDHDHGNESDDSGIGAPKEMYKPRPSRSRSSNAMADAHRENSSKRPRDTLPDAGRAKKRKLDADERGSSISAEERNDSTEPTTTSRASHTKNSVDEPEISQQYQASQPEDMPLEDMIELSANQTSNSTSPDEPATSKTRSKKKGRLKKSKKQAAAVDKAEGEVDDDMDTKPSAHVPEEEPKQEPTQSAADVKAPGSRERCETSLLDYSEDELAGDHKPPSKETKNPVGANIAKPPTKKKSQRARKGSRKNSAKSEPEEERPAASPPVETEPIQDQAPDPVPEIIEKSEERVDVLPKKKGKRGRKPKRQPTKADIKRDEDEDELSMQRAKANVSDDDVEASEAEAEQPPGEDGTEDTSTARPPLRDKSNETSVPVTDKGAEPESDAKQGSSQPQRLETPQRPQQQYVENLLMRSGPIKTSANARYRIGLSRRSTVEPLLKIVKRT